MVPERLQPGEQAQLRIKLTIAPHHHAYLNQFKLRVLSPAGMKMNRLQISPTSRFFDKVTHQTKLGVVGKAVLKAEIELSQQTPPGQRTVRLALRYQACTKTYCLLPKTIPILIPIQVTGNQNTPTGPLQISGPQPTSSPSLFATLRSWAPANAALPFGISVFFLVFFMGILTSFTPCIYPMIPITLAIIGSRTSKTDRSGSWRGFSLSFVYVLGLAVTYAILGLIAARTGALFGSLISSPWVSGTIALIFVAMALSMYGFFELQPPAFIREKLGSGKSPGGGYPGAFVTGMVAGVVASPCVGPVLVGILAFIAKTQNSLQ